MKANNHYQENKHQANSNLKACVDQLWLAGRNPLVQLADHARKVLKLHTLVADAFFCKEKKKKGKKEKYTREIQFK